MEKVTASNGVTFKIGDCIKRGALRSFIIGFDIYELPIQSNNPILFSKTTGIGDGCAIKTTCREAMTKTITRAIHKYKWESEDFAIYEDIEIIEHYNL